MYSIFNALLSVYSLFVLSLCAFFGIFTIRQLLINRTIFIFLYHIFFALYLFFTAITGGGVQNDGYKRLEIFIMLEKNNQLADAKKNPEKYNRMLQIDLKEFKNSIEFRNYLEEYDCGIDRSEAICIGWIYAFLTEISLLLITLLRWLLHRKKNR